MHPTSWVLLLGVCRAAAASVCVSTIGFYAWATYLAGRFFARRASSGDDGNFCPGVSVLKPVRGLDPEAAANFASFFEQDYPDWEILFGAEHADDPGIETARRVARDYPEVPTRVIVGNGVAGVNPKVRILAKLTRDARHPLLLISDSDIRVDRMHLRRMVQPLANPKTAVVTCLYRTAAEGLWGRLDALALATEFVPGALVARRLEGMSFAMGAGILIRREALERVGGFARIADCLADDYLLGNLPARAGYEVELAREVVDHRLGTRCLSDLIARQNRWNLGIRSSRPWSYAGLLFMQGTAAAIALSLTAVGSAWAWGLAAATLFVRLASAWFVTTRCLADRSAPRWLWLVPIRDLLSTVLWVTSFFGRNVVWRGNHFRLERGGRLREIAS
jgi:ceramide glucosyltransferase